MKRRVTTILNFFALTLLFFALYLNFVHKDKDVLQSLHNSSSIHDEPMLEENESPAHQKSVANQHKIESTKETAKATLN